MAIPPNLENISFLDLTKEETRILSHITTVHSYTFALSLTGGVTDFTNILNTNINSPDLYPTEPSIKFISVNFL
jgi:hypothetical protein